MNLSQSDTLPPKEIAMKNVFLRTGVLLVLGLGFSPFSWAQDLDVVTMYNSSIADANANDLRMRQALKKETGIELRYVDLDPTTDDPMQFRVTAGDTVDIVQLTNSVNQQKFTQAGLLRPLDDLAVKSGYDLDKVYGKYLSRVGGRVYYLPYELSEHVVFYNKQIFDNAHVPYPKTGWTWDDYIATARKLTDPSRGIYGSLMQNWDYFLFMGAHLRGIPDYKPDGSSNFDHPAFRQALEWFKGLGSREKIQPDWLEFIDKKLTWDSMMTGKFAMTYVGSWHLTLFANKNYVRDWKFGVVAPPVFPDAKNTLIAGGALAVTKNAASPERAFRVISWMAENEYKFVGNVPALANLDPEAFRKAFQSMCESELRSEITADDLYRAIFNGYKTVPEKVVGPAGAALNEMYSKEAEAYMLGWRSLDETMKVIKNKADEIIKQTS
jgi:multiple sugar transport system substrate-binding protein